MKKLLFATAIAASAAAFADGPINATAFANSGEYNPNAANSYFYFAGESDSSVVTNTSPSITKHTANFANAEDANYLALDTEGGTLWRSLNTITSATTGEGDAITTTYDLGDARAVAATGTYLDTLVQFTVTEDDAPTVSEGDKLAIWLQAEEGVTNLMVKAGYIYDNGTVRCDPTNYVITAADGIAPGEWYRLTVKAVTDVSKAGGSNAIVGFLIYIDGNQVAASTATFDSTYIATATDADWGWIDAGDTTTIPLLQSKTVFPSLLGKSNIATLQGVGFQGTGAVDEIVWTEEDPFAGAAIDFTLTWGEGVDAVSYVLSTDLTTTNSLTSGTAVQLAPGDGTATIELIPTFTTGYEFDKVTMGETDLGLTFAIPGVTTNATLLAKAAAAAYPTYIDTTDAAIKTQYDTWRTTNGADSESAYEKQFLLNVAPATTVADDALQIDSITEVQGGWKIVVSTTVSGAALSDGSKTTYNGYLTVLAADTLADLSNNPTAVAYPVTAIAGGKVEITVTSGKFMKVELTTTAPAQN